MAYDLTANPTSLTFTNILVGQSSPDERSGTPADQGAQITAVTANWNGWRFRASPSDGWSRSDVYLWDFRPDPQEHSMAMSLSNAHNPTLTIPVTGVAINGT